VTSGYNRLRPIALSLSLSLLISLLACGGDDDGAAATDAAASGRLCASGAQTGDPTGLASPALECPSRLCLHVQDQPQDMCTDDCDDASDCVSDGASACDGDFACAAPVDQGPFACRKVCVCASAVPADGFPVDCPGGQGW
jgi:hypothetical protein